MGSEAIFDYIQMQEQQMTMNAMLAEQQRVLNEGMSFQTQRDNLAAMRDELKRMQDEMSNWDHIKDALGNMFDIFDGDYLSDTVPGTIKNLDNQIEELDRQITANAASFYQYKWQIEDFTFSLADLGLETENIIPPLKETEEEFEGLTDVLKDNTTALKDEARAAEEAARELENSLTSLLDGIADGIKAKYQDQIDALDAMTEAEELALKEQQNQKKLFDLQQKIDQAETDEERHRAQEAYNEETERQQRETIKRQRDEDKNRLRDEIDRIKESYAEQRELAKTNYEADVAEKKKNHDERLSELQSYLDDEETLYQNGLDNLKTNLDNEMGVKRSHYEALMTEENTQAEARKLLLDGDQQEIIALLNQYVPDWATAGQSSGEAFLNALQGTTPSIEAEVQRIMGLVTQAQEAQQQIADIERQAQLQRQQQIINDTVARVQQQGQGQYPQSQQPQAQTQTQERSYTVQSGDTLWDIARQYGVSVDALRSANGLNAENDRRLPIGFVLRIPILHDGGMLNEEGITLIKRNEIVTPMSDLLQLVRDGIAASMSSIGANLLNSASYSTSTINNDNGITIQINMEGYSGDDYQGAYDFGQDVGRSAAFELRSRGIPWMGR